MSSKLFSKSGYTFIEVVLFAALIGIISAMNTFNTYDSQRFLRSYRVVPTGGFTLIELLVVIAIIGMLAAVVLAATGNARSKGVDAAVKGQLRSAQSQAELFATVNGNKYTNLCSTAMSSQGFGGSTSGSILSGLASATGATVQTTYGAAETATQVYCYSTATAWMVQAPAKGTNYWCVDSAGHSSGEAAAATLNQTVCI